MRSLASEVTATYPRLDVLVNNLGGHWAHRHVTADGFEHTFALNHLASFLITHELLDLLVSSAPAWCARPSVKRTAVGGCGFCRPWCGASYDRDLARRLWQLSSELVGVEWDPNPPSDSKEQT